MSLNLDVISACYSSNSRFVGRDRMYISLQRYHLLHLLANNTGTIAVNNTARTSARLDKNRLRVILEHSADRLHPCLPFLGLQEAQEEAGMCHLTTNWAKRSSNVPSRYTRGPKPTCVLSFY